MVRKTARGKQYIVVRADSMSEARQLAHKQLKSGEYLTHPQKGKYEYSFVVDVREKKNRRKK